MECVSKSVSIKSRFNALYKLIVMVHSVRMPIGFGRNGIKSEGRPLAVSKLNDDLIIKIIVKEERYII